MGADIVRMRSKEKCHGLFLRVKIWNTKEILSFPKVCELAVHLNSHLWQNLRLCGAFGKTGCYMLIQPLAEILFALGFPWF